MNLFFDTIGVLEFPSAIEDLLQLRTWNRVHYTGPAILPATTTVQCDHATFLSHTFLHMNVNVRISLTLHDDINLPSLFVRNHMTNHVDRDLLVLEKILKQSIQTLVLHGYLHDALMERSGCFCPNEKITKLELTNQGICTWDFVRMFQRLFPNLEYLVITQSNLQNKDLLKFDWNLWPRLKGINLERNYMLSDVSCLPKNLEELYVYHTLVTCQTIPISNQYTHMSFTTNYDEEWIEWIQHQGKSLQTLQLGIPSMLSHVKSNRNRSFQKFWTHLQHLHIIDIGRQLRLESFEEVMKVFRNLCKNGLVRRQIDRGPFVQFCSTKE
jgi:hypothetical protein